MFYRLEDVKAFDWSRVPIVKIIFQTTINADTFAEHVAEIRRRVADTRIADTICYATKENQDALRVLCDDPTIDAIVVIGGKNSKNTKELAHIAAAKKPTFLDRDRRRARPRELAGMRRRSASPPAPPRRTTTSRRSSRSSGLSRSARAFDYSRYIHRVMKCSPASGVTGSRKALMQLY